MKLLMKQLAIRLGEQTTLTKSSVIAIRPGHQKAMHSHSAKSPKNGDISRWLTIAKYTRKGYAVVVPKAGNPLRSKLRVELTLRG